MHRESIIGIVDAIDDAWAVFGPMEALRVFFQRLCLGAEK